MTKSIYRSEFMRQYKCPRCHETVRVFQMTDTRTGKTFEQSIGCNCELLQKVAENQRQATQRRIDRVFAEYSLVNQSLLNASFETFKPYRPDLAKALIQAKQYAEHFDPTKPSNLFFQSTGFGTGKSHLSMSVVKVAKERGYTAIFTSTPKLLTKIRSTYNRNAETTEDRMIDNIVAADLVVFDDLGAENAGGWGMEKLFEIIDQRSGKSNIFTTNLSSEDFRSERDMARIFSRMMEHSTWIVLTNVPDYRMRGVSK
nr:MAG TPA: Replicative helicase [Caudoviricetes sp.]